MAEALSSTTCRFVRAWSFAMSSAYGSVFGGGFGIGHRRISPPLAEATHLRRWPCSRGSCRLRLSARLSARLVKTRR